MAVTFLPGVGPAPGAGNLDAGLFLKRLAGLGLLLSWTRLGCLSPYLPHPDLQLFSFARWLIQRPPRPSHHLPSGGWCGGRQHCGVGGCVVLGPRLQFGQK